MSCHVVLCYAGEHLAPHVPSILSAVASGASHPTAHVQTAALSVIEPLLPFVTDGLVPAFHQLLAALLPCAQAAVAAGNEDLLVQLCQVRTAVHVPWLSGPVTQLRHATPNFMTLEPSSCQGLGANTSSLHCSAAGL